MSDDGTCDDTRVIQLGDHAEVELTCGLPAGHGDPQPGEVALQEKGDDAGKFYVNPRLQLEHRTATKEGDVCITFAWPVEDLHAKLLAAWEARKAEEGS